MTDNIETSLFSARSRLKELRIEHRNLDTTIHELSANQQCDHLQLKRLKKQKLLLKDMIVRIESQLIPDLNA